jgi:hypothetical protein
VQAALLKVPKAKLTRMRPRWPKALMATPSMQTSAASFLCGLVPRPLMEDTHVGQSCTASRLGVRWGSRKKRIVRMRERQVLWFHALGIQQKRMNCICKCEATQTAVGLSLGRQLTRVGLNLEDVMSNCSSISDETVLWSRMFLEQS